MEMSGYVASHIKERGLLNFKLVVVAPERTTGGGLRLSNADPLLCCGLPVGMSATASLLPLAKQVSRCIYLTWDVLMDFYDFPSSPTRSAL